MPTNATSVNKTTYALRIDPGLCFMHSAKPESPIITNGRFDTISKKFGMPSNVRVSAKR